MFVFFAFQHRMRPDIACLLTPHIYSELENHPSVLKYENIKVCIVFSLLLCLHHTCVRPASLEGQNVSVLFLV